ncbi:12121_t:CDS:2 [Ambispora leptoticha]|uniref:12121_t:CDS:1 n=1 Tax=Ambispora leptoticha TaxID=144679 RepID=A0A9N9FWG9_9GLOM|nr:12121_t:CDS:2 [Ambispora leptoticha]
MWACFYKTCPCLPRRVDTQPPFNGYSYDEADDDVGLESLLSQNDPNYISAVLTRTPFQRATTNTQGYLRVSTMSPDENISGAASDRGSVLLDDEATIQTQDAQYLPDEQISKLTELNTGIQAGIAKGLIPVNGANGHNKNTFFTITDEDEEVETDEFGNPSGTIYDAKKYNTTTTLELSSTNISGTMTSQDGTTVITTNNFTTPTSRKSEEQSILNKPRNPPQRLFSSEIEDYEHVDENIDSPPTNSKDQPPILPETPLVPPLSVTIQNEA